MGHQRRAEMRAQGCQLPITQMQFALLKTGFQRQKPKHFMPPALCIDQAIAKDHIAATFAIDGRAKRRMMRKRGFELCGRGQLSGVEFRIAAGQENILRRFGRGLIGQWREERQLRPGVSASLSFDADSETQKRGPRQWRYAVPVARAGWFGPPGSVR